MFLTTEQIERLTGRRQAAAQIKWLKAEGWVFTIDADGLPVVATAYADKRMGVVTKPARRMPRLDGLATAGAR